MLIDICGVSQRPKPALFVDLVGTLIHGPEKSGKFPNRVGDIVMYEGVAERLLAYKTAGWSLICVSNQGGVACGYLTVEDVRLIFEEVDLAVGQLFDVMIADVTHPQAVDPSKRHYLWRKPSPSMAARAITRLLNIYPRFTTPPWKCLMVGDQTDDMEFAIQAGMGYLQADVWRHLNLEHHPLTVDNARVLTPERFEVRRQLAWA